MNEQLETRLRRTAALQQVDRAVASSLDPRLTLDIIVNQIATQLHVDAVNLMTCNPHGYVMEHAVGGVPWRRHHAVSGPAGRRMGGARGHETVCRDHSGAGSFPRAVRACSAVVANEGFVAYHAVPLLARGQIKGVIEVFHRGPLVIDLEFREFLETVAGEAAMALDNAGLWEDVQRCARGTERRL